MRSSTALEVIFRRKFRRPVCSLLDDDQDV
jgi:hypothetical protein